MEWVIDNFVELLLYVDFGGGHLTMYFPKDQELSKEAEFYGTIN